MDTPVFRKTFRILAGYHDLRTKGTGFSMNEDFRGERGGRVQCPGVPAGGRGIRLQAINRTKGKILGSRVRTATTFRRRLKGLLGTRELPRDEGLWIVHCSSIHSFGMGYPIDVLFLDAAGDVVGLFPSVSTNRLIRPVPRAAGALELPAGALEETGTERGDRVVFVEAAEKRRPAEPAPRRRDPS